MPSRSSRISLSRSGNSVSPDNSLSAKKNDVWLGRRLEHSERELLDVQVTDEYMESHTCTDEEYNSPIEFFEAQRDEKGATEEEYEKEMVEILSTTVGVRGEKKNGVRSAKGVNGSCAPYGTLDPDCRSEDVGEIIGDVKQVVGGVGSHVGPTNDEDAHNSKNTNNYDNADDHIADIQRPSSPFLLLDYVERGGKLVEKEAVEIVTMGLEMKLEQLKTQLKELQDREKKRQQRVYEACMKKKKKKKNEKVRGTTESPVKEKGEEVEYSRPRAVREWVKQSCNVVKAGNTASRCSSNDNKINKTNMDPEGMEDDVYSFHSGSMQPSGRKENIQGDVNAKDEEERLLGGANVREPQLGSVMTSGGGGGGGTNLLDDLKAQHRGSLCTVTSCASKSCSAAEKRERDKDNRRSTAACTATGADVAGIACVDHTQCATEGFVETNSSIDRGDDTDDNNDDVEFLPVDDDDDDDDDNERPGSPFLVTMPIDAASVIELVVDKEHEAARRAFRKAECALIRRVQRVDVELMLLRRKQQYGGLCDWQSSDAVTHCSHCRKAFSITVRKHHCRRCGRVLCNDCCSHVGGDLYYATAPKGGSRSSDDENDNNNRSSSSTSSVSNGNGNGYHHSKSTKNTEKDNIHSTNTSASRRGEMWMFDTCELTDEIYGKHLDGPSSHRRNSSLSDIALPNIIPTATGGEVVVSAVRGGSAQERIRCGRGGLKVRTTPWYRICKRCHHLCLRARETKDYSEFLLDGRRRYHALREDERRLLNFSTAWEARCAQLNIGVHCVMEWTTSSAKDGIKSVIEWVCNARQRVMSGCDGHGTNNSSDGHSPPDEVSVLPAFALDTPGDYDEL